MSESASKTDSDRSSEENRRVRIQTATQEDAPTIAILGADIQEMHHNS